MKKYIAIVYEDYDLYYHEVFDTEAEISEFINGKIKTYGWSTEETSKSIHVVYGEIKELVFKDVATKVELKK